ncbi:MAG TPA: hypothetical protein PK657_03495 [Legionella sp.]|nr:hypothetical protein [Legionella sp.]
MLINLESKAKDVEIERVPPPWLIIITPQNRSRVNSAPHGRNESKKLEATSIEPKKFRTLRLTQCDNSFFKKSHYVKTDKGVANDALIQRKNENNVSI